MAIDLVSRGQINLKPLITHRQVEVFHLNAVDSAFRVNVTLMRRRFPFKDAMEAFKATRASKGPDGKMAIKVMSRSIFLW